jgi:hypothetical protein
MWAAREKKREQVKKGQKIGRKRPCPAAAAINTSTAGRERENIL